MKIRLRVEDRDTVMTATLRDSAPTRDFLALLPLTIPLEDYAGTEKIYYLPSCPHGWCLEDFEVRRRNMKSQTRSFGLSDERSPWINLLTGCAIL